MNICILSKMFPPGIGGAETYAYELANSLGERGHDVDVYTQWIEHPNETVDVHENVTVVRVCKARKRLVTFETIWFSLAARRTIDFDQYDVVHGTLMPASTIALGSRGKGKTLLVLTSHGTSLGEARSVALETPADYLLKFFFHPMNVVMDYVASRAADRVVAISNHAYDQLTTTYRLDENEVEMIPHGVDTGRFYPHDERHPAVDSEKKTLLYVGRLGARKGLGLALRALAKADEKGVEFLIAGTGRHEERLQRLTHELGIDDRVRFLGYVPDDELPVLYSSVDMLVLPSQYEGFGLVLLEAMACATPVIGADVGGIPTAITHGKSGYVLPRSTDVFQSMISKLAEDRLVDKEMSRQAREHAKSLNWDRVAKKAEKLYNKKAKYTRD